MVMVHKFMERELALPKRVADALGAYKAVPSGKTFGVVNASERNVLMIAEAHRTLGSSGEKGRMPDHMLEALLNAVNIAFEGTPLVNEQPGARYTDTRPGDYTATHWKRHAAAGRAQLQ